MGISRAQFERIKTNLGRHTSWAVWAPVGEKPKSNVGDLSMFNDEEKIEEIILKLNPNIVLAGLNGATVGEANIDGAEPFSNFHSGWSRATDYKIRFATVGTALEGAFMTDVIKDHYETDSGLVLKELKKNPEYERKKVDEFFSEITQVSRDPMIFAFGGLAYELIQRYNTHNFSVYKLYHYAFTMSKEKFRIETEKTLRTAGLM